MVAIEQLDVDGLRDLSERTDPLGVVSVYVDAGRSEDPALRAVSIDLRNRLRELRRRLGEDASSRRDVAVALERLEPQVETWASPASSGRGRIAFAALGGDWVLRLESAMSVATRVVLGDGPFLHPLLELLDEGRPAGVVLVSGQDARLFEWRLGSLRMLSRMDQPYVEAPHERAGQIGGGPPGQFHSPMREQRQARERDRTQRFLDEVVAAAAELAGERGWERIVVSGGERWTEPTVARFPQAVRDAVVADSRVLGGLDDAALAVAVTDLVHAQHAERERQLVAQIAAGRAGTVALGLSAVATALNAGRVAHLVYDPQVRYTGTVGADGALYGGDEFAPNGQPQIPQPRLTERLVARALHTGVRISPVDGAAGGELSHAAGIAAVLRW